MKNKVFYGEYSLNHWINLIRKENIILPWYQRSFVWSKEQIENLIKSIDDNQFVPPIIIGAVREKGEWKNYILDGQQRLTAILFAKYNKYIDKKEYAKQKPNLEEKLSADDIGEEDDEAINEKAKMIRWNFSHIINNKQIDLKEIENTFYKSLFDTHKSEAFFNEHFLGFAYIKPSNNINDEEQSKFYSDVFRNINTGGTKLTRLETRKSLYFIKQELKDFFAPEFLDNTKVETSSKESGLIDFIKYLSISAQYIGNTGLMRYGGRDWEKNETYYRKYITAVVDNYTENEFHFDVEFPTTPYDNERMVKLRNVISQIGIPETFPSIIEMDIYFFGLVYEIVFLDNKLDITRKDDLIKELEKQIIELKGKESHKDYPTSLKYLKARITTSFSIYRKYRITNEQA